MHALLTRLAEIAASTRPEDERLAQLEALAEELSTELDDLAEDERYALAQRVTGLADPRADVRVVRDKIELCRRLLAARKA